MPSRIIRSARSIRPPLAEMPSDSALARWYETSDVTARTANGRSTRWPGWADTRYQAIPPRISASATRSVTESKNAPRTDDVPEALATGPSSRSWRPVRMRNTRASRKWPVATETAVAPAEISPVAVSTSAEMPACCSLRPTGPVPRSTVSRHRPSNMHAPLEGHYQGTTC